MTNSEIATAFRKVADRLELEGDNPYRIRAYRRAAGNIDQLSESLSSISQQGKIRKIPGIGRDLEQRILELLESGTMKEPLTGPSPEPSKDNPFLDLPDLDPKIARLLHQRFRINDLGDLERLARSRMLRTLPGLGLKLEQDILKALQPPCDA